MIDLYQRPFVFHAFFIEKFHGNSNIISIICVTKIFNMAKKDGGRTLLEKSHEEETYKKPPAFKPISYKFARKLKL